MKLNELPLWLCAASLTAAFLLSPSASAQDRESEDLYELSPFTVSPASGYQATNMVSATRTNIAVGDLPMNVDILTEEVMDDMNLQSGSEVLNLLSSVSNNRASGLNSGVQASGADLTNDGRISGEVVIRGLPVRANLQNGMRQTIQANSALVQNVELIKGPAGVLYGLTQPGGIYNVVTKEPMLGSDFGSIEFQYGTHEQWQYGFDINRALGESGDVAARLIYHRRRQNTEFWFTEGDETIINPMLKFNLAENTEFLVSYISDERENGTADVRWRWINPPLEFLQDLGWDGPAPSRGANREHIPFFALPPHEGYDPTWNWSGPDSYDRHNLDQFDFVLRQQIGENLNVQIQYRTTEQEQNVFRNQLGSIVPGTSTIFWVDDPDFVFKNGKWEGFDRDRKRDQYVVTGIYEAQADAGFLRTLQNKFTFGIQSFDERFSERESVDQRDLRARDSEGNVILPTSDHYLNVVVPKVNNALSPELAAQHLANFPTLNYGLLDQRPRRPDGGVWFNYLPTRSDLSLTETTDVGGIRSPGTNYGNDFLTQLPAGVGSFGGTGDGAFQDNHDQTIWLSWHGTMLDDRLIAMGGVYYTEILTKDGRGFDSLVENFDESATLPQYGLIYRPFENQGLSLFALYSESLDSNAGRRNALNETFPPSRGIGKEGGIKFALADGKISGTLSYFDVRLTNRVVFDPNEPNPTLPPDPVTGEPSTGDLVARGFNESVGFDFSVTINAIENLTAILSYTNMDVESGGNPDERFNGGPEAGSFEEAFGLITRYRFSEGGLSGLSLGLGASWQGETYFESLQLSRFSKEPYQRSHPSRWDGSAFASYQTELFGQDWTFRFNINNLFERALYIGFDPRGETVTSDNIATEPFEYRTEREFFLSAEMRF